MEQPIRRRDLLLGAAAAAAACDRVVIETAPEGMDEGFVTTGGDVSPVTPNDAFYRYQCCGLPAEPTDWKLAFLDRGSPVGTIDAAFLDGLDAVDVELTLQCIGSSPRNQNIGNAVWSGLPLADVLALLGIAVDPSVLELRVLGIDDYDSSIPIADLEAGPVWLIWKMNGSPLPFEHGAPARLLAPNRYGMKNVKWLKEIELVDTEFAGYWDQYGWSHDAPYRPNGFIVQPLFGAELTGRTRFSGTAFAGSDPVQRVEITLDDGATWQDATLDYAPGPNIWALWSFLWDPPGSGEYIVRIRVTTESGAMSNPDPAGTDHLDGYNGGQEITVTVA